VILATTAAALALAAPAHPASLTLRPCAVQTVRARCGTLLVPENRSLAGSRRIALRIVVVPARAKPVAKDAFAYLAGGPGGAATQLTYQLTSMFSAVNEHHDLLLVDQRGTGASNEFDVPVPKAPIATPAQLRAYVAEHLKAFRGDPAQYGTRAAMDDLDEVRAALGYRRLDLYGGSYGATAAQVYLKRHPSSVRTMTLVGATALDVSFYGRFAVNAQHALAQIGKLCASVASCRTTFPHWQQQLRALVAAWNRHPVHNRKDETTTGTGLAGVIQNMLLDTNQAISIPLVVSRAAKGDYGPLNRQISKESGAWNGQLMYWSIWCNEPWVGLDATGPWGTVFDSYTIASVASKLAACTAIPKRAEPRSLWTFPSGKTPVLAIAGGADPQDPITNLPKLGQSFPDSRAVVIPYFGHSFSSAGCLDGIVAAFISRGTTKGLRTDCIGALVPPPFELPS
jgi:pimeloyl-ACP methyl ester carboxylesterase